MSKASKAEKAPKVLTMSYVAERWGWPIWKVTRLLVKSGCADDVAQGKGGKTGKRRAHYITTRARVREKFGDELARLL